MCLTGAAHLLTSAAGSDMAHRFLVLRLQAKVSIDNAYNTSRSPCGQGVSQSAAQFGDDETAEHVRVQLPAAHPPGFLWPKPEHAYASGYISCPADI